MGGVWRGQDGELIRCEKPYFSNLVCLPKRDLKTIYKHCLEAGAVW